MSPEPLAHLDAEAASVYRELAPRYAAGDPLSLELLAVHTAIHRTMRASMAALAAKRGAGERPVDSSALLRALRHEAALCRALAASLKPIEPEAAHNDQWAEFDNPLKARYFGASQDKL
jgi:hypothetical protein